MRSAAAVLLVGAALLAGVFTRYHAPTYTLLPLSVGAPEVSHLIVVVALAGALVAATAVRRGAVAKLSLLLAAPAVALPVLVLVQIPAVIRGFDAELRAAGVDAPASAPPISLGALFAGLPAADVEVSRDRIYARPDGEALLLDVYRPRTGGPHPIVIQMFGGGWRSGTRRDNAALTAALAGRGYVVAAIDYRLAPRWRWPAQLDDTRAALAWMKTHAGEFGADPSRVVMLGRSSGAQLAFITAMTAGDPAIRAIVLNYSPVNLTAGYRNPPVPDTLGLRKLETDFIGGTPDDMAEAYRAASPITYADRPHPPVLIVHGARDRIVYAEYEASLHDRLRQSGSSVLLEIPWADHAFDAVSFGPSAQLALHYTERFLRWSMR